MCLPLFFVQEPDRAGLLDAIKNPELGKNRLKGAVNKVVKAKKTAAVAGDFMSQMRDKMEARRSVGTERSRFARAPRIATTAGTKNSGVWAGDGGWWGSSGTGQPRDR